MLIRDDIRPSSAEVECLSGLRKREQKFAKRKFSEETTFAERWAADTPGRKLEAGDMNQLSGCADLRQTPRENRRIRASF